MPNEFDPNSELSALRAEQAKRRRKMHRGSKLARFRAELVALRQAGASLAHLALWLGKRKIRASRSAILRYLNTLPALCHG
ncbi:MAG: hypothetical protein HY804_05560 [Nitrospinae bacterium]|nr:hypothetical protein [Nitrospinota bacterium]